MGSSGADVNDGGNSASPGRFRFQWWRIVLPLTVTAAVWAAFSLTDPSSQQDESAGSTATAVPSSPASPTDSATPTPTPTATPTPTPLAKPLSKFEGEAPVIASRKFAAALAEAITTSDKDLSSLAGQMTKHGLREIPRTVEGDMGLVYPGPVPFTPIRVKVSGNQATVLTCMQTNGWGLNKKTNLPDSARAISPIDLTLVKTGGVWKLDDLLVGTGQCSKVTVKGIPS